MASNNCVCDCFQIHLCCTCICSYVLTWFKNGFVTLEALLYWRHNQIAVASVSLTLLLTMDSWTSKWWVICS
jgi:hypothetical protein